MTKHTESTSYLELDSTYRNRMLYPDASSFEINITGNTRGNNSKIASDPIIVGAPLFSFKGNVVTHASVFNGGTAHIPVLGALASSIDDFYNGSILTNTATSETSLITNYNGYFKTATLETPFTIFAPGAAYSITDQSDSGHIYYNFGENVIDDLCELYLTDRSIAERRTIIGYDPLTKIISVDTPFSVAWNVVHQYEISDVPQISNGLLTSLVTGPLTCNLGLFEPVVDNVYVGYYIRFTNGALLDQYRYITAYNGATKLITFTPPVVVSLLFPQTYQILKMDRDNVVDISESMLLRGVLQAKILELSIPNVPLRCGGLLTHYPFVYVTVTDKNNETNFAFASNNPNSSRVTFKCPIDTGKCPKLNTYITLTSKMMQVLRLHTTIVFKLTLPNGDLVKFKEPETFSPKPPNPNIQISCTLKLKKHVSTKKTD